MTVIAFDESGSDGENLVDATHAVYSHGSVRLDSDEATAFISELRELTGAPSGELKSSFALRPNNVGHLLEMIARYELYDDRANVYLAEKSFFVVGKVISLVVEELFASHGIAIGAAAEKALADDLARFGPPALGGLAWNSLLRSFNQLVRRPPAHGPWPPRVTLAEEFEVSLERCLRSSRDPRVTLILNHVWNGRQAVIGPIAPDDNYFRDLDPTIPSLVAECGTWALRLDGAEFDVIHDEHWSLNAVALDTIARAARAPVAGNAAEVRGITLAVSGDDARIQVADLIAGVGRVAGELTLRGEVGHPLQVATTKLLDYNYMHGPDSALEQLFSTTNAGYLNRLIERMRAAGFLPPH